MPYFGPRDGQYDPDQIPLPDTFNHELGGDQPPKLFAFREAFHEKGISGYPLKTEDDWRRMIARYWGLCSLVDTCVGRILFTLEEQGLDDNTIVVFTSDHGDMMGSHRLLAKCVMYEEAMRVPWIVRLPGQKRGRRIRGPISQIDMVPTLLDLLGAHNSDHLPGRSRAAWLRDGGPNSLKDDVFIEWNGPNSDVIFRKNGHFIVPESLRNEMTEQKLSTSMTDPVRTIVTPDGWKFNRSESGDHELYDLNSDPGETMNLTAERNQQERIRDLTARIDAWLRTVPAAI
jgi:arylsulfatase A-like enzyme